MKHSLQQNISFFIFYQIPVDVMMLTIEIERIAEYSSSHKRTFENIEDLLKHLNEILDERNAI